MSTAPPVRHRFALGLIVVVATLLFAGPLLRDEVLVVRDHSDYFQPLRWFTAMELRAGRLPLWNPYNASGEAWLANPQTGVFYPPSWLFLAIPFARAYVLYLLLHVALLGWGGYRLFARMTSPGAAMVGAVALMLAGPVLSLLDVSNNLATFAWLPLVLFCALDGRPVRGGVVLAMAFLAGEPFFAALGAAMYVAIALRQKVRIRNIVLASAIAFGLSAVQLLPFLELVRTSERASGSVTGGEILRDSMPLADWLRIAVPPHGGVLVDPKLHQHFIPIVYVGIAVLLLAAIGLATSWRRPATHGWLALLAFAVAVAAGPAFLVSLPLTLFRYPARLVPFAALAIAALAALGWERLRPDRRWVDLVVILIVVVDLRTATAPLFVSGPFRKDVVPYPKVVGEESKILRIGTPAFGARSWWVLGYLNLYDRRYDVFTAAPLVDNRYYATYLEAVGGPKGQLLAFLPVGWVISDRALGPPMQFVTGGPQVALYRHRNYRPMAAVWTRVRSEASADAALRAMIDGRSRDALTVTPAAAPALAQAPFEVYPFTPELTTSSARVVVSAPRDGVLVLAQRDAPGWRVTVDGKASEKLLANGIFRSVAVAAGHHEIVWTYRPGSLLAGAAMTLITCFATAFLVFVKRRSNRKSFRVSLEPE